MSLRKRCSRQASTTSGNQDGAAPFCATSPRCEHPYHYDFRLNGRRYRASTETSDKHKARDIEARERSRILEGRHGIRRQPDISFREFAREYLRDHAELNQRDGGARDQQIVARLNENFGSTILHEITAHRIEQWKRQRLEGRWRGAGHRDLGRRIRPGTVNRELDTLRSIFAKAVQWKKLVENPCDGVRRLKTDNRRVRILTAEEQGALLGAFENRTPGRPQSAQRVRIQALVQLALVTGARLGELLSLTWDDCSDRFLTFLETKNGKMRRIPVSATIAAVLARLPRWRPFVFANPATGKPYSSNGVQHIFRRAVERAGISTGDVTFHTLRHTALSAMIAAGSSDHTVMAISGHSSTRMLERYTHPTDDLKLTALENAASVVTNWSQNAAAGRRETDGLHELRNLLRENGGRREDRTRGLRVANAALSQLS